jgi:N-acetylated-alpha-linked acidic dipeptidase
MSRLTVRTLGIRAACLWISGSVVGIALAAGAADTSPSNTPMLGFSSTAAASERQWEAAFDRALNPQQMKAWLQLLSAEPNHVSSPHDKANAEWMLKTYQSWGLDAHIETFEVLYPTPKKVAVEMLAPTHYTLKLKEPPIAGDASSTRTQHALPAYNAFGADGDVTGELVYVNYGMPADYLELARHHISVKGKIAIARYGAGWRGLKPKLAYEHGAIGCLIYSDPRDDGYGAADPYPNGAGRPPESLQRGSVADMPIYSGDPLTPNVGATHDAKRLAISDAKTILKIPVLPISWSDAKPLLASLQGTRAPAAFRGGLPFTYHIGPGPTRVHMVVQSDWSLKPIYDVIVKIPGQEAPDQWILRGNHHDGWVFGASDPLSGNVAMMAEIQAMSQLLKQGFKPRRTMIFASWDGEEPGLLGSTEWVETHADELAQKAVAYINTDGNSNGIFGVGGSPVLETLVNQVAMDVPDPTIAASVRERALAAAKVGRAKRAATDAAQIHLQALGSGSDFTPFLQHAGIAALNMGFGDEEPSGVYHSIYDSYEHYIKIEDPDLRYGKTLAQMVGHTMLRLANAPLLPFSAHTVAHTFQEYGNELHSLLESEREDTRRTNELIDSHAFELAAVGVDPAGAPARKSEVPAINLAPLDNALSALTQAAQHYDDAVSKQMSSANDEQLRQANAILGKAEQSLLDNQGLPGRGWYRHMIVAPGLYTGYGAKTLPGVREAIEEHHFEEAERYAKITADAINRYTHALEAAAQALSPTH